MTILSPRLALNLNYLLSCCIAFCCATRAKPCHTTPPLSCHATGSLLAVLGGPVEKRPFFQIVHMTKVSTQIHSSISQYDVYKFLKKNEWKGSVGCVKVDFFALLDI